MEPMTGMRLKEGGSQPEGGAWHSPLLTMARMITRARLTERVGRCQTQGMARPRFTSLVESLPAFVPFVGPEAQERQRERPFRARLGANESLFGPSPKAVEVMRAASADNWMYSDPESHDLRAALAHFHGVGMDNVVIGEG